MFKSYPGYTGLHTQDQATGALPNGTRVIKINSEPGDGQPNGAAGTILGSITVPAMLAQVFPHISHFYFVEWDLQPSIAVGIVSPKLRKAENDS